MPATITKHVNMRGKHFTIKRTTSFNVTLTEINYLPFLFVFLEEKKTGTASTVVTTSYKMGSLPMLRSSSGHSVQFCPGEEAIYTFTQST